MTKSSVIHKMGIFTSTSLVVTLTLAIRSVFGLVGTGFGRRKKEAAADKPAKKDLS